jgi:hypothetical protein
LGRGRKIYVSRSGLHDAYERRTIIWGRLSCNAVEPRRASPCLVQTKR